MRTTKILAPVLAGLLLVGVASAQTVRVVGNEVYIPTAGFDPNMRGPRTFRTINGTPITVNITTPIRSTGTEYVYALGGPTAPTPATAPAPAAEKPEVDIMEAAGTLTDPTAFIYLSKEFVFNLIVLAYNLGVPGVEFDPDALPPPPPPPEPGTAAYNAAVDRGTYGTATGAETGTGEEAGTAPQAPQVDRSEWFDAVSVSGHEEMGKLYELVKDVPEWERVVRLPLPTTEKQKIDKSIAGIYAMAFNQVGPQGQYQYSSQYSSSYYSGNSPWAQDYNPEYSPTPPPGTTAATPAPTTPPPVDPQAMGEWYYYYQQLIGWERYVSEETLMLKEDENPTKYDLETALGPQDLYLIPSPDNSPQMIHFDEKETEMMNYISAIRPSGLETAREQMLRSMRDWAEKRGKEDSDRSREFVTRLDQRQERRIRYRDWLKDQATEIQKMAEDYRKRLAGEHIEMEGMEILLTREPLENVPFKARNIVTDRLTPYDLLDQDGKIIRPPDESLKPTL